MIDINPKIKNLEELASIVEKLKSEGKVVSHCHGTFDLMHLGHIKHFESAKKIADVLVVTITQDQYVNKGPGRPVFSEILRAEAVASLQCVDYVAINQWPNAVETIKLIKPNFYVKGGEYRSGLEDTNRGIFKENEAVKSVGGQIYFTDEITFSSSHFINNYLSTYSESVRDFLKKFRAKYSAADVKQKIKELKSMKVLVIGDAVIDEYHFSRPLGKSGKENLVVMQYLKEELYAGGILALANHLASFCDDVHLVTTLGSKDSKTEFISKALKPNISTKFFYRADAPTVVKRRFVDSVFLNKLFEIYYFEDSHLPQDISTQIKDYLNNVIGDYDLVIVLDYAHGFLNPELIDVISRESKFLAVNTQTNSANYGFNLITKYPRADYICIDEPELRLATHQKFAPVEDLTKEVANKLNAKKVMITRGHRGSTAFSDEEFYHTPVFSTKIVDRVGAGDAFLAITSPCVAAGFPMDLVSFIGNIAGALKIQVVGNKSSVESDTLLKAIDAMLK